MENEKKKSKLFITDKKNQQLYQELESNFIKNRSTNNYEKFAKLKAEYMAMPIIRSTMSLFNRYILEYLELLKKNKILLDTL